MSQAVSEVRTSPPPPPLPVADQASELAASAVVLVGSLALMQPLALARPERVVDAVLLRPGPTRKAAAAARAPAVVAVWVACRVGGAKHVGASERANGRAHDEQLARVRQRSAGHVSVRNAP